MSPLIYERSAAPATPEAPSPLMSGPAPFISVPQNWRQYSAIVPFVTAARADGGMASAQMLLEAIRSHYENVLKTALPEGLRTPGGELPTELADALNFCVASHGVKSRRYGNLPVVHHPVEVACELLRLIPEAPVSWVIAALLHDVVEDTEVTQNQVRDAFDADVARTVKELTKNKGDFELSQVSKNPTLDAEAQTKREQNRQDWIRIAPCSAAAHTIKCIDRALNLLNMAYFDSKRHERYVQESKYLLQVLTKADPLARRYLQEAIRITTTTPTAHRSSARQITRPRLAVVR